MYFLIAIEIIHLRYVLFGPFNKLIKIGAFKLFEDEQIQLQQYRYREGCEEVVT